MLSWFRRRKYQNEVLAELMAIHLLPDNRFKSFLRKYFPGAFIAIRNGHENGQETTELAIYISSVVMVSMIEALDDERRQSVQEEIVEWVRTPNAIYDLHAAVETAQDGFAGRIKWAIAYIAKLERDEELDDYFLEFFSNEIFGSLAGKSSEERTADRLSGIFEKAIPTDLA